MERKVERNEANQDKPANDKNAGKPRAGHDDATKPNAAGGKPGESTSTEMQTDRLVNEGGPSKPSDSQPRAPAKSPAGSISQPAESREHAKPTGRNTPDTKDGSAPSPSEKPKSNTAES